MKFLVILVSFVLLALCAAKPTEVDTNNEVLDEKPVHPHGEPVKIVRLAEDSWETNEKALETLLMHPEVVDRKLVVASIVGVVATGKTTFMDYCLRFIYANVSQLGGITRICLTISLPSMTR
jgi:hypothetical protein